MAGSGTASALAENVPDTDDVKLPMLVPTMLKPGVIFANARPTADGCSSEVITSDVSVSASGGAPTASAPPAPLPNVTSENTPDR